MEEYLISPEQMLRRGLRAVGCGSEVQARCYQKTNVKNFKAHYGPHPNHCATIWKDILVTYSLLDSPDEVNLRGFFLGLHFLRLKINPARCLPDTDRGCATETVRTVKYLGDLSCGTTVGAAPSQLADPRRLSQGGRAKTVVFSF
jgi:hypothetical protein